MAAPVEWGKHFLPRDIAKLCYEAGWIDAQNLLIAVSVCIAESNGYEKRRNYNHDDPNDPTLVTSTDRGLWMINDKAHPGVTDADADNARIATKVARQLYVANGNSFSVWSAFNNGQYKGPRAMGYAFDGVANFLRVKNGFPVA